MALQYDTDWTALAFSYSLSFDLCTACLTTIHLEQLPHHNHFTQTWRLHVEQGLGYFRRPTSMDGVGIPASAGDQDQGEWQNDFDWSIVAMPCDDILQDMFASDSFFFDNAVPPSHGRPIPSVGQLLAPGVEDRQSDSPPLSSSASDPAFGQHPCLEAGFSASLPCNSDIADGRYQVTFDAQDFSGLPFVDSSDAGLVDTPNINSATTQEADACTPSNISPASESSSATAAHVSERNLLTDSAASNSAIVGSQHRPHRCGSLLSNGTDLSELRICDRAFHQLKDLRRHITSCHPTDGDRVYLCSCGKECRRKDNHSRHVNLCTQAHFFSYECKCSYRCEDKGDYLNHLRNCRFGRRSSAA